MRLSNSTNATLGLDQTTVTVLDDDVPVSGAVVRFAQPLITVVESHSASVSIVLLGSHAGQVSVSISAIDVAIGTAPDRSYSPHAGSNFSPASGTGLLSSTGFTPGRHGL